MNHQSIIRWRFLWVNIWVIGISYLVLYVGEDQFLGSHYTAWFFGLFVLLFGAYYCLKTRMYQFLVLGTVMGTAYWHYEAAAHLDTPFTMLTFYIHLVTFFAVMLVFQQAISKAIKLELHARRMFRLAAKTVSGTENGFTRRPYSAGRMDFSIEQVMGLGLYLAGKDIVLYRVDEHAVVFSFSMNVSPLVDHDFTRTSTVSFNRNGHISVSISKEDYDQYRKKLSFDQLCESFATLFLHFLDAYEHNHEDRIIDELKSA